MVDHVILSFILFLLCLIAGRVPSLQEGNLMENIFVPPWKQHRPIVLGSLSLTVFLYSQHRHACTSFSHPHAFTSKCEFPRLLQVRYTENEHNFLQDQGSKMLFKILLRTLLWSPFLRYGACHRKMI